MPRGVLLQATTYPDSPLQKAVSATECRWPPWRTCCRQPSKRAWELSLTPPGRSSGHGYDNMEMLMLVEERRVGLSQSQWPDLILVFGEPVELLAQGWNTSSRMSS